MPDAGASAHPNTHSGAGWSAVWPTAVPVLAYGLALTLFPLDVSPLDGDSRGYLEFDPTRSAGYPLFLRGVRLLSPDLRWIQHAQLFIFCAALLFLAAALGRVLRSRGLAVLAIFAIAGNPFLAKYHFTVLSESLFTSLTMVTVGLFALCLDAPRVRRLVALGAAVGAATAVRPAGWAFAAAIPLLLFVGWRDFAGFRWRVLVTPWVAVAAVVGLDAAVVAAEHGDARTSLAPRHLFAKSALVAPRGRPPYPAGHPERAIWLALDELGPIRDVVSGAPWLGGRTRLLEFYELGLQYYFGDSLLEDAARASGRSQDEVRLDVARARIAAAPGDFLSLALVHYVGLWTPYAASHPWIVEDFNDYLAERGPLPPLAEFRPDRAIQARPAAWVVLPVMLFAFAGTVALFGWGVGRLVRGRPLETPFALAVLCAATVHGCFALVSLTAIGIPRYTLTLWPALVVCGVAALAATTSLGHRPDPS